MTNFYSLKQNTLHVIDYIVSRSLQKLVPIFLQIKTKLILMYAIYKCISVVYLFGSKGIGLSFNNRQELPLLFCVDL